MPLAPGSTLGSYQVTAKIGEGGMGEVYQARDTKLDRDVALKVLPEAFTADPDRAARFEREAKVLASLNHPNIGGIHGLEESDGVKALVLELIEGPTLADRIKQGPLPVDEALSIATQIAEALEAAHEAGVIHRDLKPANIKVREDGTVKVLDFGLAKAFEPSAPADPNMSLSPTISLTAAATQMGMIVGTAAYMAPEQAKGKAVDKRADIWAFGAVLYEMLTGTRPFAGDDVSTTLARVIEREPDWGALPAGLPSVLASFLRRCLAKEPRQRLHDVADLRLAIEGVFEPATPPREATATPQAPPWQRPVPLAVIGLGLLVAGVVAGASLLDRGGPSPPAPSRFTQTLADLDRLTSGTGARSIALSPDGRTLVYLATVNATTPQLFRRPIDRFEATPIPGTAGAASPVLSPDGQWVAFASGPEDAVAKVSVEGGVVQPLAPLPAFTRGIDWGDDDLLVYGLFDPGSSLMQVPAAGGEPTALFTPDDDRQSWYPQVLTEHDVVLFTLATVTPTSTTGELYLLDRATGEHRLLLSDAVGGHVLDSGHLVFTRAGNLWAAPLDIDRLDGVGVPVPVVEDIRGVDYALSDDGSLVYVPGDRSGERTLVWASPDGRAEPLATPEHSYVGPSLSPDGTQAAVGLADELGNVDIWVSDLVRGTLTRLTTNDGRDHSPLWTPDGRRVVFASTREGQPAIFWKAADGTGSAERLLTIDEADDLVPFDWSPDGDALIFTVVLPGTGADIGLAPVEDPTNWQPLLQTDAGEQAPSVSPDGRWLAYMSDESGEPHVYVRRFPDMSDRQQISTVRATYPDWSDDGRELFYLSSPIGPPMTVERVSVEPGPGASASLSIGAPERLFDFFGAGYSSPRGSPSRRYDISSDGRLLTIRLQGSDDDADRRRAQINVVLDWTQELSERVPVP